MWSKAKPRGPVSLLLHGMCDCVGFLIEKNAN